MKLKSLFFLLVMANNQFAGADTISDPILQAAIDAIAIPNSDAIKGNITLPTAGENNITYSWTSGDSTIIKTKESPGYIGSVSYTHLTLPTNREV